MDVMSRKMDAVLERENSALLAPDGFVLVSGLEADDFDCGLEGLITFTLRN